MDNCDEATTISLGKVMAYGPPYTHVTVVFDPDAENELNVSMSEAEDGSYIAKIEAKCSIDRLVQHSQTLLLQLMSAKLKFATESPQNHATRSMQTAISTAVLAVKTRNIITLMGKPTPLIPTDTAS